MPDLAEVRCWRRPLRWMAVTACIVLLAASTLAVLASQAPKVKVAWEVRAPAPGTWVCILNRGTPEQPDLVRAGIAKQNPQTAEGYLILNSRGAVEARIDKVSQQSLGIACAIARDRLYLIQQRQATDQQYVAAYTAQGQQLWEYDLPGAELAAGVEPARHIRLETWQDQVYVPVSTRDLVIITADGARSQHVQTAGDTFKYLWGLTPDGALIATCDNKLACVNPTDGIRWEREDLQVVWVMSVDEAGKICYWDMDRNLGLLDSAGNQLWLVAAQDLQAACQSTSSPRYGFASHGSVTGNVGTHVFLISAEGKLQYQVDLTPVLEDFRDFPRPCLLENDVVCVTWAPEEERNHILDLPGLRSLPIKRPEPRCKIALIDPDGTVRGVWAGPVGTLTGPQPISANTICGDLLINSQQGQQADTSIALCQIILPE